MKNAIANNREMIILTLVIAAIFGGAIGLAVSLRGGQPWAYAQPTGATVNAATR